MSELNEQLRNEIYRQMRVCSEMYKPIFSGLMEGSASRVSSFVSEVLIFEEMLHPYIIARKESDFEYLKPLEIIDKYKRDPTLVYRELYLKEDGKRLDENNPEQANEIGKRRTRFFIMFERIRQVLNRFAFELGLVDVNKNFEGSRV